MGEVQGGGCQSRAQHGGSSRGGCQSRGQQRGSPGFGGGGSSKGAVWGGERGGGISSKGGAGGIRQVLNRNDGIYNLHYLIVRYQR